MTWLNRFFKEKSSRAFNDPLSERLRTPEPDRTKADERWKLLYERLKRLFEGWGFDDAHDLANHVIMILYRQTTEIGNPQTFFRALGIARGVAANAARRKLRESKRAGRSIQDGDQVQKEKQLSSLLEDERDDLRWLCLNEALDELPPAERELFKNYHNCLNAGLTGIECAEQLGMNYQTFKNKSSLIKFTLTSYVKRCMEKFGY